MNLLLISGFILSFVFSAVIFFRKKDKSTADKILAIWMIFLGLGYLRSYLLFEKDTMFLLGFGYTLPALNAPFLFMYVYALTSGRNKYNPRLLFHLIPFVLFNLYLFFFLYIKTEQERYAFFHETTFATRPLVFHIFELIMILTIPVYLFWILKFLRNHVTNIRNRFSCRDKIDLNWINYLLLSVAVLWLVIIVTKAATGYYNNLKFNDTLLMVYYFELIIIVIIGYFGFHQEVVLVKFIDPKLQTKNVKKYSSTGLSNEDASQLKSSLMNYMESEKPYLIPDLTLDKLSEMVSIPSHHVSQIINEQLGKNFYEFVNEYRVEEVKRLITENKGEKFTLLSLAHDSGFNSKSTFNSIFKKYTRLTPKEYMNKVAQKG